MATKQIDGTTNVTATSTVNNGGVAKNIGSSANLLTNSTLGRDNVGVFGSKVLDNSTADKAVSAGTFAYNNQSPVAKRLTTRLSGVSNTVLRSGAAQPDLVKSVHKILVKNGGGNLVAGIRTRRVATAIRAGNYNIYTGLFSAAPTVAVDEFGADDAANVSRSNQGSLFYKTGAKNPVTDSYDSKTA